MSRYRNERDDYYGERGPRERAGSYEDRYDWERGYGRGGERSGGYGEEALLRGRGGYGPAGRDDRREDYGRDRYGEPIDYRSDDRAGRGGSPYGRGYEEREPYGRRGEYGSEEREPPRRRGASRSHVRCRDIMTRDVTVATRETTLQEVAAMMRDEDTGVIPVVEAVGANINNAEASASAAAAGASSSGAPTVTPSTATVSTGPGTSTVSAGGERGGGRRGAGQGRLVGLITDRDIVLRAVADGRDPRTVRAEEIMTADIHSAQPNDRVIDAIRKMGDKQVRRIPVVDHDGNLRGIISMADVALETEEDRELANALEEISSGASFWSKIFG